MRIYWLFKSNFFFRSTICVSSFIISAGWRWRRMLRRRELSNAVRNEWKIYDYKDVLCEGHSNTCVQHKKSSFFNTILKLGWKQDEELLVETADERIYKTKRTLWNYELWITVGSRVVVNIHKWRCDLLCGISLWSLVLALRSRIKLTNVRSKKQFTSYQL